MNIAESAVTAAFGKQVKIEKKRAVYGGDINDSMLLCLSDGRELFIKINSREKLDMFRAEEAGLKAIASTGAIRVPKTIASGATDEGSYLLMEYIKEGQKAKDFWENFANALADMHSYETGGFLTGGNFGFRMDDNIGATKQVNTPCMTWLEFFSKNRLGFQFELAGHYFSSSDRRKTEKLMEKLPDLIMEPERPALIHGDLWAGNFITGSDGQAMLIDPAVYVGHPEADIAMTELFGGYAGSFYRAYRERGLIGYGYGDRKDLYNLYHLLNHLNLFGSSYYPAVMRTVEKYI